MPPSVGPSVSWLSSFQPSLPAIDVRVAVSSGAALVLIAVFSLLAPVDEELGLRRSRAMKRASPSWIWGQSWSVPVVVASSSG